MQRLFSITPLRYGRVVLSRHNVQVRHASVAMGNTQRRRILENLKYSPSTLIFDRKSKPGSFRWLYGCAFGQLIFWANLADIGWRVVPEVDEGTGETRPTSKLKRGSIAAGTMLLGLSISWALLIYGSRCVLKAYVINYGTAMRLETAALFGSKVKEFPLPSIYARSKLYTGRGENKTLDFKNTQYILNSDHDRLGFVLDRRGYFKSPADLDALFLRQPIPTR